MKNFIIVFLFSVYNVSCDSECDEWKTRADKFYNEKKVVFFRKNEQLKKGQILIDSLISVYSNIEMNKSYVSYTVNSIIKSDGGINKQDAGIAKFMIDFNFEEIIIDFGLTSDSIPAVVLYSKNMDEYNPVGSCPAFSAEVLYSPIEKSYVNDSYNFLFYKLNDHWWVRASIASL